MDLLGRSRFEIEMSDWRNGIVAVVVFSWLVIVTGLSNAVIVLNAALSVFIWVLIFKLRRATKQAKDSAEACERIFEEVQLRYALEATRAAFLRKFRVAGKSSETRH